MKPPLHIMTLRESQAKFHEKMKTRCPLAIVEAFTEYLEEANIRAERMRQQMDELDAWREMCDRHHKKLKETPPTDTMKHLRPLAHATLLTASVGFILYAAHGHSITHFVGCAIASALCFFASRGIQGS